MVVGRMCAAAVPTGFLGLAFETMVCAAVGTGLASIHAQYPAQRFPGSGRGHHGTSP